MVDGSVSAEDINRLFRTGIITYYLPSGKSYMRTIGKQNVEAAKEDEKDNIWYDDNLSNKTHSLCISTTNAENNLSPSFTSKENN